MNVLICQTELNPGNPVRQFHFGAACVATYLRREGHNVELCVLSDSATARRRLLDAIGRTDPGIIGFSSMTDEWSFVSQLAAEAKAHCGAPIVCGGPHPTMAPGETLSDSSVDVVCRGEGELAMAELCRRIEQRRDHRDVANLWLKDGRAIVKNAVRPLIEDLDRLPFPDTDLFDYNEVLKANGGAATFMAGRGCPYRCHYCVNWGLHGLYQNKGQRVRRRSPQNAIEGLKALVRAYPAIACVNFDDDAFLVNRTWAERFLALYADQVGLPFGSFMRIEMLTPETLPMLIKAGFSQATMGVESGSEWLRRVVLGRNMSNERIRDTFRRLHESGVRTTSLNMVGLPFETPAMAEETLALNADLKPDLTCASIFQAYPGTRLREVCLRRGWLRPDAGFTNRDESTLNLPGMTQEQIRSYAGRLLHLGEMIAVRKRPMGSYDFLVHFDGAEKEVAGKGRVGVARFSVGDEASLEACPPSRVTYRVRVDHGTVLHADVGVDVGCRTRAEDGVLFAVEVARGPAFMERDGVMVRYVNPRRHAGDSEWIPIAVDLRRYAGQEVRLSFITRLGPRTQAASGRAGWRRPRLDTVAGAAMPREGIMAACTGT